MHVITMEAMTIMGMAASQARFLGLTARKSNVEYQGQQVNQQRTSLANESANLYNQMMELTVPTPPATSDFYKTSYVLEDSQSSYASGDYRIGNLTKTYEREGEYTVTLICDREYVKTTNSSFKLGSVIKNPVTSENEDPYNTYNITLLDNGMSTKIYYDESQTNAYTGENGSLSVNQYQIYKADPTKNLNGYDKCCTEDTQYYFYQDSTGKNFFITEAQLKDMVSDNPENDNIAFASTYTYTKEEATQVIATLESSSTGRYSTIVIAGDDKNPSVPNDLKGKTFALSTVQEMDQNAYDDAYNDYEYNKALYEKSISDINAQTEIIQKEDQQLELRLQQLNTEQDAIKTELDSVKQVIKDNVESTFKVFA